MKKMTAILLAAILCASALAGCGNDSGSSGEAENPSSEAASTAESGGGETAKTPDELLHEKYEEPVKITFVLSYRDPENPDAPDELTPETATAIKKFKEELNIEVEYSWIVNTDQYESKFGAELAAGNLPDVMSLSANQFEDLYSQGGLGDMTEAYNNYVNEDLESIINYDGEIINTAMRDGKIYGIPKATYPGQSTSQTYYDMNKLKEAGITSYDQLPKTIEEFEALCDQLLTMDLDGNGKTGDPVLPAGKSYYACGLADFSPVFEAYGAAASGWYDDGTGTLVYSGVQPEVKEVLTKLNEWYNKGYVAKDFAAQDVYAADSPLISDIAAGKFAIIPGSWWIPNWPLNENKKNDPDADWVVGPTLTLDGQDPVVTVSRYPLSGFTAISRDCEHPEAVFKMMNWELEYEKETANPNWIANASEEQLLEKNSHVYHWLPWTVYNPTCLVDNYEFISKKAAEGSTTVTDEEALGNSEFWGAWNAYVKHVDGTEDAVSWGTYTSRVAPEGGVAKMYEYYTTAEKRYNEVYVTTPSMITKQGEMGKYQDTTFLSMIMGETPIDDFDKFVEEWNNLGGADIGKEVNEWYQSK